MCLGLVTRGQSLKACDQTEGGLFNVNKLEGSGETCQLRFLLALVSTFFAPGVGTISAIESFLTLLRRNPKVDKTLENMLQ